MTQSVDTPHSTRPNGSRPHWALGIRVQRLFAWSGLAMLPGFLIGWGVIGGYLPPSNPSASVEQILAFYTDGTGWIRLGLWIAMMFCPFMATWSLAISAQLARIEGGRLPLLSAAQAILGGIFVLEFIFPLMIWQAAAFRPEVDPEMTYRLHDLAWLLWLGVVSTVMLQAIIVGVVILLDRRPEPVFPRWMGYLSLMCCATFVSGGLCVFFKTGPLGWNGIIAWWLLVVGFAIWMISISVSLLKHAIPHEERELAAC